MNVWRPTIATPRRRRQLKPQALAGLVAMTLVTGLTAATSAQAKETAQVTPGDRAARHTPIEAQVRDEMASDGTTTFWVYLRDEADLTMAASIVDRGEQGRFVYEQLTETAEDSQAGLIELLDAESADYQEYWIANTVQVTGDEELLERITALPDVEQVTADRTYELPEPVSASEQPTVANVEWNIDRISAPQVWDTFGVAGQGIVVGSIDSGVQFDHPALVRQYRGNLGDGSFDHNYHWWDPSNECGDSSPCDNDGHGTHVTGTMVGDDGGGNQIGVAPGAQWIAAKACENRSCSQGALLSSGQFMLAPTDLDGNNPDPERRPHIVNNSWGGGPANDPWYRSTVEVWVQAGIFPQFAAGNTSSGFATCASISNPGNLPESYAAGAFDIDNAIAGFSNRGPSSWDGGLVKPNIAAPGVDVRSAQPGNSYGLSSGTSMASPHVAGVVALMWSAAPALGRDIDATRDLLDETAIDIEDLSCGGEPDNNNVWGQGRLDAFAAVDASPRGPVGRLAGTVTDTVTDAPIAGATIAVTGDLERQRTTGPDGAYSVVLPVGEYTVTASAFGYEAQPAEATIAEGETTTQDFPLQPLDRVTVSGVVTDGAGHGWPLYAKVNVVDTPMSTFTDPATGQYSLTLPADEMYTISVEAQYPGYPNATDTLEVALSDVVHDASLAFDIADCTATPGYEMRQPTIALVTGLPTGNRLPDYLEEQGLEYDWFPVTQIDQISGYDIVLWGYNFVTVNEAAFHDFLDSTDADGTGVVFLDHAFISWSGIKTLSSFTGQPESVSTRTGGSGVNYYEVTQEHPILDGFDLGQRIVHEPDLAPWVAWFNGYEGEGRQVIADVGRDGDGTLGSGIGVQLRENNRHALLSIHSQHSNRGPNDWSDESEEIFWNAIEWVKPDAPSIECVQVDGGLVLGHVVDQNTGDGVNDATVGDPEDGIRTFGTPDDSALDDGFYWMFSAAGSQEFTASAATYVSDTRTVQVAASSVTEADFALAAGQLAVDPAEVESELQMGKSAERSFTITNTGTAPATAELIQRGARFELLGDEGSEHQVDPLAMAGEGAEVNRIEVEGGVPYGAVLGDDPGDGDPTVSVAPSQDAWEVLPDMPRAIMDNNLILVDNELYSFGGTDGTTGGAVDEVYVYDVEASAWERREDGPAIFQQSAQGVIDGLVYLVSGFRAGTSTWVYDPVTGSWQRGADVPVQRAAAGTAVLDGQLYLVGGCTTNECVPFADDVFRYDPAQDSWQTLPPYPERAGYLSCGGVAGLVVCAGGGTDTGTLASTYAYNPITNEWRQRADMPADLWGSAYHGANDLLLVSGGAARGGTVTTNEGYAYNPDNDTWQALPPANHSLYRAGSTCGFYRVGGSSDGFDETPTAEVLPGFDDCGEADPPTWLSVDRDAVAMQPGEAVTVTVTVDGDVEQPGTFTAQLGLRHDTPYINVDPVDVTMTVTPPNNWGEISGTVLSATCDGDIVPLRGANVQLDGRFDATTVATGSDGGYAYWMAVRNNPLQVSVTASGHEPQTRRAVLRPRHEKVADFTLQATC